MALKTFDINDGVLIDKRKGRETEYSNVIEPDGSPWVYIFLIEQGEETMEWPALTKTAAEAKVDDQDQPETGSIYDDAEWEMMEDDRVVGSYILTRTRTYTKMEWYIMVKMDEE